MEIDQLEKKLSIIFDKVLHDQGKVLKDEALLHLSQHLSFNFPDTKTIIDLFSIIQQDDKLKASFIKILKDKIITSEENQFGLIKGERSLKGLSPFCFLCLIKIGYIEDALQALRKRRDTKLGIYTVIDKILHERYFNSSQLEEIYEILNKTDLEQILTELNSTYTITNTLQGKLIDLRHDFLEKEIRGTNIEINQDKKTITEKIRLFGFGEKYGELLDCIDYFLVIETPKPLNAGMINNLRTFMADLVTDVAESIAKVEHEEIPTIKESKLGNMRKYLKNKLDFTDKDEKLIDSFIDVLHSEGGHSFMSEKEYFRLARNIAIEIALFILSKYGKKYQSEK